MKYDFINTIYSINELYEIVGNNKISVNEWCDISCYQTLSLDFIDKYSKNLYWNYISVFQKLSCEFIEKHKDKVNWNLIIRYQELPYSFLEKNIYYYSLYIEHIDFYQNKKHLVKLQDLNKRKFDLDKIIHEVNN